jgi:uncharacterized membrane protein
MIRNERYKEINMKNWKCIVGTTIATPICICLLLGLLLGFTWLINNITVLRWAFFILSSIIFLGLIWAGLFFSCCDFLQKRKPNQPLDRDGKKPPQVS